jgi:hypothetical protein
MTISPQIATTQIMNDRIVREAFHYRVLRKAHKCTNTFVVDELSIKNGLVRADIAVLNGKLIGYEIKTEKDTLERLTNQVLAYNEVFDKAFIVLSEKHLSKALQIVPDWWGVYLIEGHVDKLHFRCFRKAQINKFKSALSIAQFLWKSEATEVFQNTFNKTISASRNKQYLYREIAMAHNPTDLGRITLNYLKNRKDWRISHSQPL